VVRFRRKEGELEDKREEVVDFDFDVSVSKDE
jgi:hypothetical protein